MKKRYPRSVGTRPADVCGCWRYPRSSRSAMTLRRLAGESWKRPHFARERELIASPVATCCMTISRSTSRARPSSSSPCWLIRFDPWHSHESSASANVNLRKMLRISRLIAPLIRASRTFSPQAGRRRLLALAARSGKRVVNRRVRGYGFAALLLALPLSAGTVDRVAAVVDRQVITVSEITQMVELRFFARNQGESEDDYRHRVLEALIAQALRFRDVERFGA